MLPRRHNDPLRHQQYRHAAEATLIPRRAQGLACPLGAAAEGDVDHRAAQPTLPTPHPPALQTTLRTVHALTYPRGGDQALLDRGIHQRHRTP